MTTLDDTYILGSIDLLLIGVREGFLVRHSVHLTKTQSNSPSHKISILRNLEIVNWYRKYPTNDCEYAEQKHKLNELTNKYST